MRGSTAGIGDGFKGRSRRHYALLSLLDTLLACLVVSPLTIACWRGCWELMDLHVVPGWPRTSAAVSLATGALGQLLLGVFQRPLAAFLRPDRRRLTYYAASRLYTAAFAASCVGYWRGVFLALHLSLGAREWPAWALTLLAAAALLASRTARNVAAPPFVVAVDSWRGYFEVPTMFRLSLFSCVTAVGTGRLLLSVQKEQDAGMYVLDCVFSVAVIGTLSVVVWRGVWTLLDSYLYPDSVCRSAWGSLLLGYGVVLVVFALQPPMKALCTRLAGRPRLAAADLYVLVSFFGTVNVWRGVWLLLDAYFLPDSPHLSNWLSFSISLLLLMFMNCSNSILVRGVYIDGEEEGGKCVVFPCYYLRLYFQNKRKERLRQIQVDQMKQQLRDKAQLQLQQQPDPSDHHLQVPLIVPRLSVEPPEED
ncbi:uncharacterized protein LOC134538621 [Bacillus rossius redtenbacheri]|uniref:uncharacterized protein LOC134538621 n=1 Tax=Bacillus rossius redtenbacheri TaxID=93214 RepID=UPI002FDD1701